MWFTLNTIHRRTRTQFALSALFVFTVLHCIVQCHPVCPCLISKEGGRAFRRALQTSYWTSVEKAGVLSSQASLRSITNSIFPDLFRRTVENLMSASQMAPV